MQAIRDFLSLLATALLLIAIPILIPYAVAWIRNKINALKQTLSSEQLRVLEMVGSIAVRAAEQAGEAGLLAGGAAKKDYAVNAAQQYFEQLGIKIDVEAIAALIESEVIKNFNSAAPPADTPQARAELIERAIQAAVLAAEQSGLKHMAVEVGRTIAQQKKEYAMNLALKYLAEHGLKVDAGLVDGLIEAQIMRFRIEAAGS